MISRRDTRALSPFLLVSLLLTGCKDPQLCPAVQSQGIEPLIKIANHLGSDEFGLRFGNLGGEQSSCQRLIANSFDFPSLASRMRKAATQRAKLPLATCAKERIITRKTCIKRKGATNCWEDVPYYQCEEWKGLPTDSPWKEVAASSIELDLIFEKIHANCQSNRIVYSTLRPAAFRSFIELGNELRAQTLPAFAALSKQICGSSNATLPSTAPREPGIPRPGDFVHFERRASGGVPLPDYLVQVESFDRATGEYQVLDGGKTVKVTEDELINNALENANRSFECRFPLKAEGAAPSKPLLSVQKSKNGQELLVCRGPGFGGQLEDFSPLPILALTFGRKGASAEFPAHELVLVDFSFRPL